MPRRQSDELSRAEKIRNRNQQSRHAASRTPIGGNVRRKETRHKAPVTQRQPPAPMGVQQRHRTQAPSRSKGALSGLRQFQLGWRIISGALFLFSLSVVISLSGLDAFSVNSINLVGAQRLTAEVILSQLDLTGQSIISVKPAEIQSNLIGRFPELRSANIVVGLPATLTIEVSERQPVVLWSQHDTTLWIDEEGIMFPIRGEADLTISVVANSDPPAPAIIDPVETDFFDPTDDFQFFQDTVFPQTTPEFVQGIRALGQYVPDESQLQYDPRFGLGWEDPNGWLVYFGVDTNHMDIKLAEYQKIITAMQEKNITPDLISLEFLHAPFYRLEQ